MLKKFLLGLISGVSGCILGMYIVGNTMGNKVKKEKERGDKHLELFMLMDEWVRVKQEGKNLAEYLDKKGYRTIAIYGLSYVGEALLNELKESDIKIKYAIDQRADDMYSELKLLKPDDEYEEVDAIIVTSIRAITDICEKLEQKVNCPIISMEDLLYEV